MRKEQAENSLAGAYFTNVGTYNFVDNRDDTFLSTYSLTSLENALGNAKNDHKMRFLDETEQLEANLNAIYKVCKKNRANFLPFGTSSIPESQLKNKVDKALSDSVVILSDLVSLSSKNYTDKFGIQEKLDTAKNMGYNDLYPTYVKDFEVAKKYINFTLGLDKISNNAVVISVRMAIPFLVKAELHRINYVPRRNIETKTFEFLRDQSIGNLGHQKDHYGYNTGSYFIIKDIDKCQLMNETFLCDPAFTTKVQDNYQTCVTLLFSSDCNWESRYDCTRVREKCMYEESRTRYKEFTYLGDNKFFASMTREANYIYKCDDGRQEEGVLIFNDWNDHRYAGTVEIEENCSLSTAFATIFNKNGAYEIREVDNDDLIWADVPKIIGVPVWIFAIAVAVVALIVLMLSITWICICVKRCKTKKAAQYNILSN